MNILFPRLKITILLGNWDIASNVSNTFSSVCEGRVSILAPTLNLSTFIIKVSKGAKIRNRYNQVPHLTQDTNGNVTNSQLDTTNESQALTCKKKISVYTKMAIFIKETDTFGHIVLSFYTVHIDHSTLQNTTFEQSTACLSVVFELLSGFIPFAIL